MTTVHFEIYFEDLTDVAQHYLCKALKTTPEEENWETIPLVVIDRELKEEKKEEN